jgi:Fur family transcriptional regulator, ferric uptake regulator
MPARQTEQRRAIVEALRESPRAITAQELHERLDGVGLATVYRNLQRLVDEGVADALRRESGEQAFLLCGSEHHHHLTCRSCGRVERVRDCRLDEWARAVALEHGFRDVDHRAELVGECPACAQA